MLRGTNPRQTARPRRSLKRHRSVKYSDTSQTTEIATGPEKRLASALLWRRGTRSNCRAGEPMAAAPATTRSSGTLPAPSPIPKPSRSLHGRSSSVGSTLSWRAASWATPDWGCVAASAPSTNCRPTPPRKAPTANNGQLRRPSNAVVLPRTLAQQIQTACSPRSASASRYLGSMAARGTRVTA
jgi:hypothetical protein